MMSDVTEVTEDVLKSKIKQWELSFLEQHKRKPNSDDINSAPCVIKEWYRKYWKCRSKKTETHISVKQVSAWSSDFNKSNVNTSCGKSCEKNVLHKFSQKLKKCAVNQDLSSLKFALSSTSSKNDRMEVADSMTTSSNSVCSLNKFDTISKTLASDVQSLKPFKIDRNISTSQSVNEISMLSTTDKSALHFQKNINKDWLKKNLTNDPVEDDVVYEKVSGKNSFKQMSVDSSESLKCNSYEKSPAQTVFSSKSTSSLVTSLERKNCAEEREYCKMFSINDWNVCVNDENKGNLSVTFNKHGEISASIIHESQCTLNATTLSHESNDSCSRSEICFKTTQKRMRSESCSDEECHLSNEGQCQAGHGELDIFKNPVERVELLTKKAYNLSSISKKAKKLNRESISKETERSPEKSCCSAEAKQGAHLTRKIKSGALNENFIRINIRKKHFSRGHHKINVKKEKWRKWKQKSKSRNFSSLSSISSIECFKCNKIGHWSRNCPESKETNNMLPVCEHSSENLLPTIEVPSSLAKEFKPLESNQTEAGEVDSISCCKVTNVGICGSSVLPFYHSNRLTRTPQIVFDCLKKFGFSAFKEGQEKTIMRILCGLSTLVVLPTGLGKSLCYQLPAYLYAQKYKAFTLVISPLISLMEDQVSGLASCIHAVSLSSAMSDQKKKNCIESIRSGKAQILLISPEAVIYGKEYLFCDLPPIAFACIDEAHCLSEWSHNFRPSYLQLYKVLTQNLGVGCILGLTATATRATITDLAQQLNLHEDSIIGHTNVPHNLYLSVSQDKDKDLALIKLLRGDRFRKCSSIIIYCMRRDETERLAAFIRTCLQETDTLIKGEQLPFTFLAEAYHAGLTASKRRSVQKQFMAGKLRIVVATIAFGMGLNKSDVRAVIHYNMPKSFENYVQEIGRAGRDGADAHCHVFLNNGGLDVLELKRHIYSNGLDRYTVKKLLKKIFVSCKCSNLELHHNISSKSQRQNDEKCPKHEVAFSVSDTVLELDLKEENISTLLCYLELNPNSWIEQLPLTYKTCTIHCYGGHQQLIELAEKCPAVAIAMARDKLHGHEWDRSAKYQFQIIDIASHMDQDSSTLKQELKRFEWDVEKKKKTGIVVEFSDLAFHLRAPGNLTADEVDLVSNFLYQKVKSQEKLEIEKLQKLNLLFHRFSYLHYWSCCDQVDETKSGAIKEEIKKYFKDESFISAATQLSNLCPHTKNVEHCLGVLSEQKLDETVSNQLLRDIQEIIHTNHDQKFTGRAIARIFHGIDSPCYPAKIWSRVLKFWRCHLDIDFNIILKMSNEQLRKVC